MRPRFAAFEAPHFHLARRSGAIHARNRAGLGLVYSRGRQRRPMLEIAQSWNWAAPRGELVTHVDLNPLRGETSDIETAVDVEWPAPLACGRRAVGVGMLPTLVKCFVDFDQDSPSLVILGPTWDDFGLFMLTPAWPNSNLANFDHFGQFRPTF